jgi:hypothetical protein
MRTPPDRKCDIEQELHYPELSREDLAKASKRAVPLDKLQDASLFDLLLCALWKLRFSNDSLTEAHRKELLGLIVDLVYQTATLREKSATGNLLLACWLSKEASPTLQKEGIAKVVLSLTDKSVLFHP